MNRNIAIIRYKPNGTVDKQQMLILAENVPRFTLLPIAAPAGQQNDMRKSTSSRKSIRTSKSKFKTLPIINLQPSKLPSEGRVTLEKMIQCTPSKSGSFAGLPESLHQKTTSDLFSSASSFIGSYWGAQSPSSPAKHI